MSDKYEKTIQFLKKEYQELQKIKNKNIKGGMNFFTSDLQIKNNEFKTKIDNYNICKTENFYCQDNNFQNVHGKYYIMGSIII